MDTFTKQSGETLDYDVQTDDWLTADDFLTNATSSVDPVGLTISSTTVMVDQRTVKVWVSGGTNGTKYKVQVVMTTDDGRVKEHEFQIKIKDR